MLVLIRRVLTGLLLLAAVLAIVGYWLLQASLPSLDGQIETAGLAATVTVERDELGIATITAANRLDAAYATGFVHAQERFFQMDLQRRVGAGELAALFGAAALSLDKANRLHRFRWRADKLTEQLVPRDRALYEAYTNGVNAGLAALAVRPFEYLLLGVAPEPWRIEDSLLTVYSMYFELNDESARRDSQLGLLRDVLPAPLYQWLVQPGTEWDAPLRGGPAVAAPLPGPEVVDLRELPEPLFEAASAREQTRVVHGSNNWSVSGDRSADGRAMVAGDMHLGHAVPNIWFRARIRVPAVDLDITGVTLPGTPLVVAGSNRHVAWAFTNSYGDWQDLVVLETDPQRPQYYRAGDDWLAFDEVVEHISVKGGPTEELLIRQTQWGPVIDTDHQDRERALRWIAHLPAAMNAAITDFETAHSIEQAIAVANRVGAPPQNYVVADRDGHIGWTIMGRIPRRSGFDPATPISWADGDGWQGWVEPGDYPRIVDPPAGVLWTANARTVDGDWLALLGQGNHPTGARAGQIRDGLLARDRLTIDDMLAIQLDNRAVFLQRWQQLLVSLLTPEAVAERPVRGELRQLVQQWGGRAAVDSAGYRLVRAFRLDAMRAISDALLAPVREQIPDFRLTAHSQLERPVWQVISQQPVHLLGPQYASWDDFLLAVVDTTIDYFGDFEGGLADRTWGEFNTMRIAHPLTRGVPLLSRWLNMPPNRLPGDANMPRVQGPAFGASQRMAVSPGNEEEGYFHMPGGQSGHPLSPFYGSGHDDWAEGQPTPFLPGPAQHHLTLAPVANQKGQ
ncbi:MAG: penicillin acylase family protein [Gammaproteobacteria bacterium]|nr:penicillin acylase family protein [Gammaproteobacteria bacterium]